MESNITQNHHDVNPFGHDCIFQPPTMSQLTANYTLHPPHFRFGSSSPTHQMQSHGNGRNFPYARPPRANMYPQTDPGTMFDSSSALGTQDYQFQGFSYLDGYNMGKQLMKDMPHVSGSQIGSSRQILISATTPNPSYPRNSVYDPVYETMGLPVDPHLRMFLSRASASGHGNSG